MPLPAAPDPDQLEAATTAELAVVRQPSPASCNIEAIGDTVLGVTRVVDAFDEVSVNGWLLPERSHQRAVLPKIRLVDVAGSAWQTSVTHWMPRPDVLEAMKAEDIGQVGFRVEIDAGVLKQGAYRVVVVFEDGDVAAICDKDATVVIR